MAAQPVEKTTSDCPAWCRVNHASTGARFHARCAGELHWSSSSVEVVVTQRDAGNGIELAYHADGEAPAIAFLSGADTRRLRDCLDRAVEALSMT